MNYLEIYFNGVLKRSVPLQGNVISIGRAASNDIIINNMGVSSHHAVITQNDNGLTIEDLNSTNGTFFNNQKLTVKQPFTAQDTLVIGKHTLKLSEWSQQQNTSPSVASHSESDSDSTVIMGKPKSTKATPTQVETPKKSCYLTLNGEASGIKKLLLTQNVYHIGKAKDNEIRLKGWFTPAYIAEIEHIGHSFYITPLKKNKVMLNGEKIQTSALLSTHDIIQIKKLLITFLAD